MVSSISLESPPQSPEWLTGALPPKVLPKLIVVGDHIWIVELFGHNPKDDWSSDKDLRSL